MKKILVTIVSALALMATWGFAQGKSEQTPTQQANPGVMNCPMMAKMSHMQAGATKEAMDHPMAGMSRGMASMFSLSSEELNVLLKDKKTDLGLTDTQVKKVAELIASSQQKKAEQRMQQMRAPMSGGGMKCPCMETPSK